MRGARVEASLAGLRRIKPHEYVLRFLFGGTVTVVVGFLSHRFGPLVGGLFLAFPSILPASLTLVVRHDGRGAAADEAHGAVAGAVGLAAFGLVLGFAPVAWPPALILVLASAAWLVVGVTLWWCFLRS